MPTVTNLADRVASVTGLSETGDDRALVLGYLNQAYGYAVLEAGGYVSTFSKTLTADVADYTIGTEPLDVDDLLEIRGLWITDASVTNRVMQQVSEATILDLRQANTATSTPTVYAVRGTRQLLIHPTPTADTTLAGSYLMEPPALVESGAVTGEETTPTAIPSPFHYDVLANKAISLAMEYDNRFEEAAAYDAKWATAMERLMTWTARYGGLSIASSDFSGYHGPRDMA